MLTAEELEFIKKDAEAKWKNTQAPIDVLIQAAYDYGRRIKPLVWTEGISLNNSNWYSGDYNVGIRVSFGSEKWYAFARGGYASFHWLDTVSEAKSACQQHHNEFILGALE